MIALTRVARLAPRSLRSGEVLARAGLRPALTLQPTGGAGSAAAAGAPCQRHGWKV